MPDTTPAPDVLDALRAQGAPARDPVGFRLAEALARRASAHAGAAREAIEARLAGVLRRLDGTVRDGEGGSLERDVAGEGAPASVTRAPAARGLLAALVSDVARQKPLPVLGAASKPREAASTPSLASTRPVPSPAPDGRTLQFFKRTWSRLSAEQRLAQSRATLPDNAGPLNSHHLVHRALTLMQSLSPDYLEHFVGYVDALQWLEQANEAAAAEPRAGAPKRSAALRR